MEYHTRRNHLDWLEDEDDADWRLVNREASWRIWRFMEATRDGMSGQWSFLPEKGGWLDQPQWLVEDLTKISERSQIIKEQLMPAGGRVQER